MYLCFNTLIRLFLLTLSLAYCCQAQMTGLSFRPLDAQYSLALDRIVFVSGNPNQLHIYNPLSHADRIVPLAEIPINVSIGSDGTHAAVAFADAVAYVDLQAATVLQTFSNPAMAPSNVVLGSGYIYLIPTTYLGGMVSISLSSGQVSNGYSAYPATNSGGVFNPLNNALYSAASNWSPSTVSHYDASNGAIGMAAPSQSTTSGTCAPLTLSRDGSVLYSACGETLSVSSDPSNDMRYLGAFAYFYQAVSLTVSGASQIATIPAVPFGATGSQLLADTVVNLFTSSLNPAGTLAPSSFAVGANSFPAHGRWVFYNASSTSLIIVTQADPSAALELDYAVEVVDMTKTNSCTASFAIPSVSAPAIGGYATTQIDSGTDCLFTAASNVPWIVLSSGYYGSGNTTLTYLLRPNLASTARSGTITVGTQTFTVAQAAAGSSSNQTPLSLKPVAADYDKPLDKVVMVSAAPNELHIYDPLTQADQIVPLAFAPLSVSVSPDGQFAAVGQDGHLAFVNLQSLTVTQEIPVHIEVQTAILAGNGYAYILPGGTYTSFGESGAYSVQMASGSVTLTSTDFSGASARLSADGSAIYEGGNFATRFDITANPALPAFVDSASTPNLFNFWLSEDGTHMISSIAQAYVTSSSAAQDFAADGSLNAAAFVAWAADSKIQNQTAILLGDSAVYPASTQLQIYSNNGFQLQSQVAMPTFTNNGQSFMSHGRWVFWNAAATKLFAFVEADAFSGMLSDHIEYTVDAPESLPPCTYAVSPTTLNVGPTSPSGVSAFVNITGSCSWSWSYAQPQEYWFGIYGAGGNPTVGSGQVVVQLQPSAGPARSQTFTVANQTITLNQSDSTCTYTLSSSSVDVDNQGGTGSVDLTTASGCAWTVQPNASWITIANGGSGVGPATIQFTAVHNNSAQPLRSATVTVAGLTNFYVTQRALPAPLSLVPVTPCRIIDTRNAAGPFGGPYLSANSTRSFAIPSSSCHVPLGAWAYSLNVTVVPHKGLSYLTVWPTGQTQPLASTLNSDGRTKAVAAIVQTQIGNNGAVSFFATDDTELIVDINGYFVPASFNELSFYPLTPCRIADTRNASGTFGGPAVAPGQTRDFPVLTSACNVPSSAQAYSLNFTTVPQNQGIGYLSTWPTGQTQPLVSTLNDPTVTVEANAAIVPAGTNGDINVYSSDKTDLVIDINGYFAPPGTGALHFYTLNPCRVLDTRNLSNPQPLNGTLSVPMASCNVPTSASAVVINTTVVPQTWLGYLSLWPTGTSQPLVSTLNADDQAITSNMAIVPLGNGSINAYSSNSTHLIVDVSGYFAP